MPSTLYITVRARRRPISDSIVSLKLTCNYAVPVHRDPVHVEEISDFSTMGFLRSRVQELGLMHHCSNVELDLPANLQKMLERNG